YGFDLSALGIPANGEVDDLYVKSYGGVVTQPFVPTPSVGDTGAATATIDVPGISDAEKASTVIRIPLNDNFDDQKHDAAGHLIPDNEPDAVSGYQYYYTDPQIMTVFASIYGGATTVDDLRGTWSFSFPDNVVLLWLNNVGSQQIASGQ